MRLIALLILITVVQAAPYVRITIPKLGTIQGTEGKTYFSKRTIYKFMGIPYAEPPVGVNRFMRPKMKSPWRGILDATQHGDVCPQLVYTHSSENCLFLDIYIPKVATSSKLPVLFEIHGGSYTEGTSQNIKPDFLLEHNVVLVAPQYRLGPLGFIALVTTNKTGNAALYDLLMALQWVHDHIEHFGGDPHRITIGGNSAGAGMAAQLYLSPLTQDIIKQVILFSGSAFAVWATDYDPFPHSRAIAKELGCSSDLDDNLLICLRMKDPLDMIQAYYNISTMAQKKGIHGMGGTRPIVDNEIITELPEITMKKNSFNRRPLLSMVTRDEGIFLIDILRASYFEPNNITMSSEDLRSIAEVLMTFTEIQDPTHLIALTIADKFFMDTTIEQGIIDFMGAAFFKGPSLEMVKLNSKTNMKTFLSTFNYDSHKQGVDHVTEQLYIFARNITGFSKSDYEMARKLTRLCANFLIKGTPTEDSARLDGVHWSSFSEPEENYLVIDKTPSLKHGFSQEFTKHDRESQAEKDLSGSSNHHEIPYVILGLFSALYIIALNM